VNHLGPLDTGTDIRVRSKRKRPGDRVIIAGTGGAAHLPGMTATKTILQVIGVPIESKALKGLDSLLSIVQMPGGVPVATMAIGMAGARNAGILTARILRIKHPEIADRVQSYMTRMTESVLEQKLERK